MSQGEILKYLKEHSSEENPKSGKEISKVLKVTTCSEPLRRLRKSGDVFFKNMEGKYLEKRGYLYWHKNGNKKNK